jgi:hypothetical protein
MIELLFVALVQTAAGPAAEPPQAAPTEQAADAAAAPLPEPVVRRCRMERREGSNLRVRVSTTASEDQAMHDATSGIMRDVQSQSGRFGQEAMTRFSPQ